MKHTFKYLALGAVALMLMMPASLSAAESAQYDSDSSSALRAQLREKDEQIDKYLKKLISIASNFLFLPYEKYSIDDVAIPAFETAKGTDYYTKYRIRLTLLKNYKADTEAMIKFLSSNQNQARNHTYDLSSWASSLRSQFNAMQFVQSYREYGEGWVETYLGKMFYTILDTLQNTSGDQAAQRIDAKFTNLLRQIKSGR